MCFKSDKEFSQPCLLVLLFLLSWEKSSTKHIWNVRHYFASFLFPFASVFHHLYKDCILFFALGWREVRSRVWRRAALGNLKVVYHNQSFIFHVFSLCSQITFCTSEGLRICELNSKIVLLCCKDGILHSTKWKGAQIFGGSAHTHCLALQWNSSWLLLPAKWSVKVQSLEISVIEHSMESSKVLKRKTFSSLKCVTRVPQHFP